MLNWAELSTGYFSRSEYLLKMIQSKYKIYLDMDGVIVDWVKQFENYSGGLSPEAYVASHGNERRYELVHQNSPAFYAMAPWTGDGRLLYHFVSQFPTEILSRSADAESTDGKKQWLESNGIKLKANLVPNIDAKTKFAAPDAIMIDDRSDVIDNFTKAGGQGILHTNATDTINKLKEILGVKEQHRIYNSILNPEIFEGEILKPEVHDMLLKITTDFYKNTELTAPIEDIYFLGSSAGYNWTPTSDMDLHVLIDFKLVDPNKELVKKLVSGYKNKWNDDHNLHYHEHPIEVHIQDVDDVNRSQAVYSVLNNHWVKKPQHENIQIDKPAIKAKYKQLVQQIDNAITSKNLNDLKDTVKRLYNMRETGLSTGGEYSTENIVFKLLRSSGYISKLRTNINYLTDTDLNKV